MVTFIGAWVVAQLVSSLILLALGDGDTSAEASFGVLAVALCGAWASYLIGMWIASQRAGSGSMIADYGISFRWIDLTGLAIGAGSQLVLIRVVYLPLEALWPGTFTEDRLTENAQDLVDRAGGASTLLLFAVVVIGAIWLRVVGSPYWGWVTPLALIPLGFWIWEHMVWSNQMSVITDRRVVQMDGVLNKQVSDSILDKLNDVKTEQSLLGRFFGYGEIEILTASDQGVNRLHMINDPLGFKRAMLNAKEALEDERHSPRD